MFVTVSPHFLLVGPDVPLQAQLPPEVARMECHLRHARRAIVLKLQASTGLAPVSRVLIEQQGTRGSALSYSQSNVSHISRRRTHSDNMIGIRFSLSDWPGSGRVPPSSEALSDDFGVERQPAKALPCAELARAGRQQEPSR